jgi:hypothetical protein
MARSLLGFRLFGAVDTVPGTGCVATRFFHVGEVPLVPLASFVVPSDDLAQYQTVPPEAVSVPLDLQSVLHGYLSAAIYVVALAALVVAIYSGVRLIGGAHARLLPTAIAAGVVWKLCLLAFFAKERLARASHLRAREIREILARAVASPIPESR